MSENSFSPSSWHSIPAEECLTAIGSSAEGLSHEEAERRLSLHGPNTLPAAKRRSALLRFLAQFNNILIYVLIVTALITLVLQHYFDSLVILAVVVANAVIGFLQEGKAEAAMNAIHRILAVRAAVLRNGERLNLAGEALVPGDIVILESGDKVPADLRLIGAHGLQIQESILTGESMSVDKTLQAANPDAVLGDRHCMAFSGTLVTSGQGRGVVVATGVDTEIGRIGGLLEKVESLTTPLIAQMNQFARWLTVVIIGVALALLGYGYYVAGFEFSELFMAVVGLSVAAIPEGLPAVLTITLAVGVKAMAERNAIIRRLPAIETLGSVSVICTDKTGTLTRNEMMVATVVTCEQEFSVQGEGYRPEGAVLLDHKEIAGEDYEGLQQIGRIAQLCNDAALHNRQDSWEVEGDPMEGALLALAGKVTGENLASGDAWTRMDTVPFDPRYRYMATLHQDPSSGKVALVKGAPEQLLAMCHLQQSPQGESIPLNLQYWQDSADRIAAEGQRVLALAFKPLPPDHSSLRHEDIEHELILAGLVGLIDPPRPEAVAAIAECYQAGIQVKMITGDHKGTAAAIGKLIGLKNPDVVLTGSDLDGLSDEALAERVLDTDIFARTSPEDKLRLVTALQRHDLAVAMTGDGVNDAPALRRADTGIAMGRKGSEAAKEAAEFVLADDNFASIVAAIREGRTVYDNIKKVISWTLPTSAGEALTITVALIFGMTLPISPIQILWINLITTTTLGLALAFEPTEESTMRRPPRRRNEPLLGTELAWHIALVSALFVAAILGVFSYAINHGVPVELARTLSLNTLVVLEIFHLFFIRNIYGTSLTWKAVRGTRAVWTTVVAVTLAQLFITYAPIMQVLFETRAVPLPHGLITLAFGVVFFAMVETEKQIRLRFFSAC